MFAYAIWDLDASAIWNLDCLGHTYFYRYIVSVTCNFIASAPFIFIKQVHSKDMHLFYLYEDLAKSNFGFLKLFRRVYLYTYAVTTNCTLVGICVQEKKNN